jgi:hypothetical protein
VIKEIGCASLTRGYSGAVVKTQRPPQFLRLASRGRAIRPVPVKTPNVCERLTGGVPHPDRAPPLRKPHISAYERRRDNRGRQPFRMRNAFQLAIKLWPLGALADLLIGIVAVILTLS